MRVSSEGTSSDQIVLLAAAVCTPDGRVHAACSMQQGLDTPNRDVDELDMVPWSIV